MPSLNKVFLAGNLTRSPELRYTPGGTAVAQFGLAVNRRFRNREGQMQEEVTFVDIEVWGRQAEAASEYISKGSPVLIEGRLKLDSWESKQTGERRSKLRVVGERVQFLRYEKGDKSGRGKSRRERGEEGWQQDKGGDEGRQQDKGGDEGRQERPGPSGQQDKGGDEGRQQGKDGDEGGRQEKGVDDLPPDDNIPF